MNQDLSQKQTTQQLDVTGDSVEITSSAEPELSSLELLPQVCHSVSCEAKASATAEPNLVREMVRPPINIGAMITEGRHLAAKEVALKFMEAAVDNVPQWQSYFNSAPDPIYLAELDGLQDVRNLLATRMSNMEFLDQFNMYLSTAVGVFVILRNGSFELHKMRGSFIRSCLFHEYQDLGVKYQINLPAPILHPDPQPQRSDQAVATLVAVKPV